MHTRVKEIMHRYIHSPSETQELPQTENSISLCAALLAVESRFLFWFSLSMSRRVKRAGMSKKLWATKRFVITQPILSPLEWAVELNCRQFCRPILCTSACRGIFTCRGTTIIPKRFVLLPQLRQANLLMPLLPLEKCSSLLKIKVA